MASRHVDQALQTIDDSTWVIGDRIILCRTQKNEEVTKNMWGDGTSSCYSVRVLDEPSPKAIDSKVPFPLVHSAGCGLHLDAGHAVWKIGEAFLKVAATGPKDTTREHTTLQALCNAEVEIKFAIPEVYYHAELDGRYYIVLSEVIGIDLQRVWWKLDAEDKEACAEQVVQACEDLAAWQMTQICGVDGKDLDEPRLIGDSDSPEALIRMCQEYGMECSTFVFYHCDLNPGNVLWNSSTKTIGIIDWEAAGFVPREWIRTNFHKSTGMALDTVGDSDEFEWVQMVDARLEERGFEYVTMD